MTHINQILKNELTAAALRLESGAEVCTLSAESADKEAADFRVAAASKRALAAKYRELADAVEPPPPWATHIDAEMI